MKKLILFLFIGVLFTACKKSDSSEIATPITPSVKDSVFNINTPVSFYVIVDGIPVSYKVDSTTIFQNNGYGISSNSNNDTAFISNYNFIDKKVGENYYQKVQIVCGRFPVTAYPTTSEFSSWFKPGIYTFYNSTDTSNIETFGQYSINCVDSNNVVWSTEGVDQTGSNFVIVERVSYNYFGEFFVKYNARFNCKLTNGTKTVSVINGKVVGTFRNI